ncbi:MAG: ComF family protein [Halomonadaceae bacterium]|nr:MAG: ComF family protein [Halomonadaceae bacterium]
MINVCEGLSTLRSILVNSLPFAHPLDSLTVCNLCLAPTGGPRLCHQCLQALPHNHNPCLRCALPLPLLRRGICGQCLQRAPAHQHSLAPFLYRFPVDHMITRYKYSGERAMGFALTQAWLTAFSGNGSYTQEPLPQALIPCPISPQQLRWRGFNQSAEIAWQLGRALGIPVLPRLLTRIGHQPRQATLDRQQRRRNLRHAFVCTGAPPARVALVDDVITTGATADAMAQAVLAAGAEVVHIWALARTP